MRMTLVFNVAGAGGPNPLITETPWGIADTAAAFDAIDRLELIREAVDSEGDGSTQHVFDQIECVKEILDRGRDPGSD